jgi:hypothetical protein
VDGVFGTLMKDPVKLPSSGLVVDRFNAEKHIALYGRDMMDDSLLALSDLIELPELKQELDEWRELTQVIVQIIYFLSHFLLVFFHPIYCDFSPFLE